MRSRFHVVGIVVALATPGALAQTEVSRPAGDLAAGIGDPPRLDEVAALVRDGRLADPTAAYAVAEKLASRGGYAAAQGLFALSRHRDATVRFIALRGVAEVGLRRADGPIWVRAALHDADAMVRTAAYEAIGRVGDASDLPLLLEGLASEDERTRGAAGRSITTLTGLNLPTEDPTRWADWWKQAKSWIPAQLDRAIDRIDAGGERSDLADARALLAQYAWFDLEKVQGTVVTWLRTFDSRHRAEGYRAAASCRLGDLAEDVRRAAFDETEPGTIAIALRTGMKLGIALDGMTRAPAPPALVALLAKANDDANDVASDDPDATLEARVARFTQEMAAAATGSRDGTEGDPALTKGHAGSALGQAVWLDLEAKRERWRKSAMTSGDDASDVSATATSTSFAWSWIGVPLLVAGIAAAAIRWMRRRGDEAPVEPSVAVAARDVGELAATTPNEALALELGLAGIDPEALAATGVRAREVERIFAGARQWMAENAPSLLSLESNRPDARIARRESLFEAATAALSTESKERLVLLRSHRAVLDLPLHLLVVERTDAEWHRIGEALARKEAAQQTGATLPAADESLLDAIRLDHRVRRARLDLNQLLGPLTTAWRQALTYVAPEAVEPVPTRGALQMSAPTST